MKVKTFSLHAAMKRSAMLPKRNCVHYYYERSGG
jgi:hypothetical protein